MIPPIWQRRNSKPLDAFWLRPRNNAWAPLRRGSIGVLKSISPPLRAREVVPSVRTPSSIHSEQGSSSECLALVRCPRSKSIFPFAFRSRPSGGSIDSLFDYGLSPSREQHQHAENKCTHCPKDHDYTGADRSTDRRSDLSGLRVRAINVDA
jgi:hypothetical protein